MRPAIATLIVASIVILSSSQGNAQSGPLTMPLDSKCAGLNAAIDKQDLQTINKYQTFIDEIYQTAHVPGPFDPPQKAVLWLLKAVTANYCRVLPAQTIQAIVLENKDIITIHLLSAGVAEVPSS